MAHFHEICHRKFDISYVGGFLELRKFNFRVSKVNSMAKRQFRGPIAEIGDLKPILASRPHVRYIFINSAVRILP